MGSGALRSRPVRRLLEIAAGLGVAWLAQRALAAQQPTEPTGSSPPPAASVADTAAPAPAAPGALREHAAPVASYTLRASLDPWRHVVTGDGTIRWRNASSIPQHEVRVHLYLNGFKNDRTRFMRFPAGDFRGSATPSIGSIRVTRFAVGGVDLWPGADKTTPRDPDDETDIRVPLREPVPPGASIDIAVAFESTLPALSFRTGHFGGFHMVAQWFPKLARLEPDGRWAHFPFLRLSEFYADFGDYDVTVDTPSNMIVGATGALASEETKDDRRLVRYVQRDVHDFAFTAWHDFRELAAKTDDGVAVRVLYPPGYERAAALELDAARYGLRYFGDAYGRYPYGTLTIVHPPPGAGEAGGMEYPTLITTGGFWFGPWSGARYLDAVTIHELGHQWFYGIVATNEHAWPFLDEGLNSYAENDALEARYPGASAFRGLGLSVGLPAVSRFGSAEARDDAPVAQPASAFVTGSDYGALVYARTATILGTLGNVHGKDEMRRAIGLYTRRHRFEHPTPPDLVRAVREVLGDAAATELQRALFERGTVDYIAGPFSSERDEAAAEPAYTGSAVVRRRGTLRFPVDVDMIGADGTVQRVRWAAEETAARLPYRGSSPLVAVVVDPEHRVLLDDDLGNNARSRSPRRVSGALLDRASFFAAVAFSGVMP